MPYNTQSEQIAFFNGSMPIRRYLSIDSHPRREMLGNTAEIYEAKQLRRETLIHLMAEWVEKLSKQPKCVWESDKQRETLKELKRFRRNPEVAVPELKKLYHGCLYLLKQWDYLKRVVEADAFCGDFKTSDETLILGLCEVPFWNRDQNFDFMPSAEMTPEEAHAHITPFIQEKIDSLSELLLARRGEEERDRELAIASPEFFPDKKLRGWAKELNKVERELIAIYTYVQSLLNHESSPVEAPAVVTVQEAQLREKRVEPPVAQVTLEPRKNPAELTPTPPVAVPVAQPAIAKPTQANRPTQPTQSQPGRCLSKKQARNIRIREKERRKSERLLSDLIDQRFAQTNILPITVGKRWF